MQMHKNLLHSFLKVSRQLILHHVGYKSLTFRVVDRYSQWMRGSSQQSGRHFLMSRRLICGRWCEGGAAAGDRGAAETGVTTRLCPR